MSVFDEPAWHVVAHVDDTWPDRPVDGQHRSVATGAFAGSVAYWVEDGQQLPDDALPTDAVLPHNVTVAEWRARYGQDQ